MIFEKSWRWYGPQDPVNLKTVKQAGANGVVTALHHIPVGAVWTVEEIEKHIDFLEESNRQHGFKLHWNVVESLPVHEDIKQGKENRDELIENYKVSIRNLSQCGVTRICYNFMPILDWLRTNVRYELEDGSTALYYNKTDLVIFDLFILKRENAQADYKDSELTEAKACYDKMSENELKTLKESLLMALPGDKKGFTLEKLQKGLSNYEGITAEKLRENLVYFLKNIIPLAEETGVKMAIHPDDPPWPVLGLPRIISNISDLEYIFKQVPETSNGLTFCSGSLGASAENNLEKILEKFYERIHFVHLRSVQREGNSVFFEANHLEGNADILKLMKKFYELQKKNQREALPMRPDHGHEMMDDQGKKYYPGYSTVGRMRGLAELRGLEFALVNN